MAGNPSRLIQGKEAPTMNNLWAVLMSATIAALAGGVADLAVLYIARKYRLK